MAARNHTGRETSQTPGPARRRRSKVQARPEPEDFKAALQRVPRAAAFFEKLSAEHRRELLRRLHAVRRTDTRGKRIALIVAMLARREQLQP